MSEGRTETLMERSMPEGRKFRHFKKHIKTSRTWHPIKPKHPPYAEMVKEALVSSSSSSYWPSGDLPSISYDCISSYILSKYPLVGEIHQLDHDVLLREAIVKLSREGIVYCELSGRYVILPQFSSISAASYRPPPPNIFLPPPPPPPKYYQPSPPTSPSPPPPSPSPSPPPPPKFYQPPPPPPPSSPPPPPPPPPQPQHMEECTAEERGLALVPVDIKHFILLPTGRNSQIVCDPPPHYPPPLWELGS